MTARVEHQSTRHALRRCLVPVAVVAAVMFSPVLAATPVSASFKNAAPPTGPDVSITVIRALSSPYSDRPLAVHSIDFFVTNLDSRPATIDGVSASFGTGVPQLYINVVPHGYATVQCFGMHGDTLEPGSNRIVMSSIMVYCDPFVLPGGASTTVSLGVTTDALLGDAPLDIELRMTSLADPNTSNNRASVTVEFDGVAGPATTAASQPPASVLIGAPVDPPTVGTLPSTGQAANVSGTAAAAVLLIAVGGCLTAVARRRRPAL